MSKLVFEDRAFDANDLNRINTTYLDDYPIVYILYNKKRNGKPVAYIGQTAQVQRRMQQHLDNSERKAMRKVLLIGDCLFNQSATYNIETNLISHFIGDGKFKLQNVSQTRMTQMNNYYQKSLYNETIFGEIWQHLQDLGLAEKSLDQIENQDIYKISPYRDLSPAQLSIKLKILNYCKDNLKNQEKRVFMIEGEAGTGKSVVLASLFNTLADLSVDSQSSLYKSKLCLLVNHSEMIKTYKSMAESLPNLHKNQILKPTSFINSVDKIRSQDPNYQVDLALVDEAHLSLTQSDRYNGFNYKNQMAEIIKRAKVTVLIYDQKQILHTKSLQSGQDLKEIERKYQPDHLILTDQFRMQSSVEMVQWIDSFVNRVIRPLPKSTADFKFEVMPDPESLKETIRVLNQRDHLSRIVSTFDFQHKKDGGTYLVDAGGVNLPWNKTDSKTTWAERPETINEVGSTYTIQGFDLNHVGVILGPSIDYDQQNDCLTVDIHRFQDTGGMKNRTDIPAEILNRAKEKMILDSLNVLLKRGSHGLYLYAVNPTLRQHLLTLQKQRSNDDDRSR